MLQFPAAPGIANTGLLLRWNDICITQYLTLLALQNHGTSIRAFWSHRIDKLETWLCTRRSPFSNKHITNDEQLRRIERGPTSPSRRRPSEQSILNPGKMTTQLRKKERTRISKSRASKDDGFVEFGHSSAGAGSAMLNGRGYVSRVPGQVKAAILGSGRRAGGVIRRCLRGVPAAPFAFRRGRSGWARRVRDCVCDCVWEGRARVWPGLDSAECRACGACGAHRSTLREMNAGVNDSE